MMSRRTARSLSVSVAGYTPAAWLLAGTAQGAAAVPAPADNTTPTQAGTGSAVAGQVMQGTAAAAVDTGREDLTVFFSIGVVLDLLLVAAFLVWAVRQWRKTG